MHILLEEMVRIGEGVSLDSKLLNIDLGFASSLGWIVPVAPWISGVGFPSLFLRRKCLLCFDNNVNHCQRPSIYYASLRSPLYISFDQCLLININNLLMLCTHCWLKCFCVGDLISSIQGCCWKSSTSSICVEFPEDIRCTASSQKLGLTSHQIRESQPRLVSTNKRTLVSL